MSELHRLRADKHQAIDYVRRILASTENRARTPYEESQLEQGMILAERATVAYMAEENKLSDSAAQRQIQERQYGPMTSTPSSTRHGNDFGDAIANAVAEVRNGRSVAYVDYPEQRALAGSGIGGYLINNEVGAPVMALSAASVIMSLPGVRNISVTTGDRLRLPRLNLTTVSGVAEAATLPSAATDLDALDIIFQKFATYELLSSENIEDANSDALSILGERMLKDLAVRVDSGLIQGTGASDVVGIFNQPGVSTTSVAGVPTIAKAQEAEFQMLNNDGKPSAWIMAPRSWIGTAGFRRIVTGVASSIQPVLQMDPSQNVSSLSGYPVYLSSSISTTTGATSVGSIAALVDASQLVIVTRRAPRLEVSRDVSFSNDSVAIRATARMGFAVLDAAGGISLLTDIRTA